MTQVLVRTEDAAAPGRQAGMSGQQGKTQEVRPGSDALHRSGHSVNGVINLVFV